MMVYLILQNAITQLFYDFLNRKKASSLKYWPIYYDFLSDVKFFL